MKRSGIRIKNTLALLRQYKMGIGGNYWDLIDAANRDAVVAVGTNPAFQLIRDREAGNEWTLEQIEHYRLTYNQAIRDAQKYIIDRVYAAIPSGIRDCRLFRQYTAKG